MVAHEELDSDGWLSEDEAHRLLARAVELDARYRASVSVEDLKKAASEAGIESGAFVQALNELRSGALEPVTIGERIAAKLDAYRRPAAIAAFMVAAGITPGDAVGFSVTLGLGLYGVFEGITALARLLGRTPPRVPPNSQGLERGRVARTDVEAATEQRPVERETLVSPRARIVTFRNYAPHPLTLVVGLALLLGCDTTPTTPVVDFGSCVPTEPTQTEISGVRFALTATPEVMGYRSSTLLTITLTNTTSDRIEMGGSSPCLVEKWVRGESLVPETKDCWVSSFQNGPNASSAFSEGLSLRPPGSPRRQFRDDPVDHYMGPEAPPATYCVVADIVVGADTVRLEAPFRLEDG